MSTQRIRDALAAASQTNSLREIAAACGYDHGQLSRFLGMGRDLTTGDKFDRLLKYLGLSLAKDQSHAPTNRHRG